MSNYAFGGKKKYKKQTFTIYSGQDQTVHCKITTSILCPFAYIHPRKSTETEQRCVFEIKTPDIQSRNLRISTQGTLLQNYVSSKQ